MSRSTSNPNGLGSKTTTSLVQAKLALGARETDRMPAHVRRRVQDPHRCNATEHP